MAIISPFRAWRYNPDRVPLGHAVTQPYDKISPEMQDRYYAASPYNLVRIILGKRLSSDTASENVYTRAAKAFQDWRASAVLHRDSEPSLYRYCQAFLDPSTGQTAVRQSFIAIGKLEKYDAGIIFRHEQTLAKPKADRLDLLRSTRAHFGQIFMLYSGAGKVNNLLTSVSSASAPAEIEVTDEFGVVHSVWKISDPTVISAVEGQMRHHKLIIADGHHRYETALTYRNERRSTAETGPGHLAPYDSVMMTFVDMDCPGLVILPTHRLVFGLPSFSAQDFLSQAHQFFNVEAVDPSLDSTRAISILHNAGRAGTALLAVTADRAFLLQHPKAIGTRLFERFSRRQQALDVVQLHKCLLEGVLKISEEAVRDQTNVSYCRDASDALARVRTGEIQISFLMNPVRIEQVRDIALAGEVLPQKSTDFYPKMLSGLTIYSLD
jgi:uncharacterized protein (DUF1015 family)